MSFLRKIKTLATPVDERDDLWDKDRIYVLSKRVPFGFTVFRDDDADGTIYLQYRHQTENTSKFIKAIWGELTKTHFILWVTEDVDMEISPKGVVVSFSLSDWGATNESLVAEAKKIEKVLKRAFKRAGEVPETRRRDVTSGAENWSKQRIYDLDDILGAPNYYDVTLEDGYPTLVFKFYTSNEQDAKDMLKVLMKEAKRIEPSLKILGVENSGFDYEVPTANTTNTKQYYAYVLLLVRDDAEDEPLIAEAKMLSKKLQLVAKARKKFKAARRDGDEPETRRRD